MGKRKVSSCERIENKIRKLEKKLERKRNVELADEPITSGADEDEQVQYLGQEEIPVEDIPVHIEETPPVVEDIPTILVQELVDNPLEDDIVEALGGPLISQATSFPPIHEEIYKRLDKILIKGLDEEEVNRLKGTCKIPENFQLLEAPKLNQELEGILSTAVKERDEKIEKRQILLGRALGTSISCLNDISKKDYDKVSVIRKLNDANKLLSELHYQNTELRRKLILPSLHKLMAEAFKKRDRDCFLFGDNLNENIRTTTAIKKAAASVLKPAPKSNPKTFQGNYRAPQRGGPQQRRQFRGNVQFHRTPLARVQPAGQRQPPLLQYNQRPSFQHAQARRPRHDYHQSRPRYP